MTIRSDILLTPSLQYNPLLLEDHHPILQDPFGKIFLIYFVPRTLLAASRISLINILFCNSCWIFVHLVLGFLFFCKTRIVGVMFTILHLRFFLQLVIHHGYLERHFSVVLLLWQRLEKYLWLLTNLILCLFLFLHSGRRSSRRCWWFNAQNRITNRIHEMQPRKSDLYQIEYLQNLNYQYQIRLNVLRIARIKMITWNKRISIGLQSGIYFETANLGNRIFYLSAFFWLVYHHKRNNVYCDKLWGRKNKSRRKT